MSLVTHKLRPSHWGFWERSILYMSWNFGFDLVSLGSQIWLMSILSLNCYLAFVPRTYLILCVFSHLILATIHCTTPRGTAWKTDTTSDSTILKSHYPSGSVRFRASFKMTESVNSGVDCELWPTWLRNCTRWDSRLRVSGRHWLVYWRSPWQYNTDTQH